MFRRTATLAAAIAFAIPSVANAWGQTGNRVIGEIAHSHTCCDHTTSFSQAFIHEDLHQR